MLLARSQHIGHKADYVLLLFVYALQENNVGDPHAAISKECL